MVWFENGHKQIIENEIFTSDEKTQNIGQTIRILENDFVWFDVSAPSETAPGKNVSENSGVLLDREPLVLQVEEGLNPEIVRKKEDTLRQEKQKLGQSIEKFIIRI